MSRIYETKKKSRLVKGKHSTKALFGFIRTEIRNRFARSPS